MNCKFCGKPFTKTHNREMYCSDYCRIEARKDQKAKYQRKRRRLVQQGVLIVTDREKGNLFYNSNYLSQHRYKDFNREQKAIERELKRLKLKIAN